MIHRQVAFVIACSCISLIAGCRTTPAPVEQTAAVVDLDAVIEKAAKAKQPVVILIGEFGPNGADRAAGELFDSPAIQSKAGGAELLKMDLTSSRNRASAAQYHTVQTPVLVCLSSKGVIVSRDQGPITADLLMKRMDGLGKRAADLDAKLMLLRNASPPTKKELTQESALAEFLLAQRNAREALPYLDDLASSDSLLLADRVNAWVAMARAHLWIGEPEKARHEAKDLIATLGPTASEAIAGGNLVLGLQDITAKRYELARREFQAAIAAAPQSAYAAAAADELANLPKESK